MVPNLSYLPLLTILTAECYLPGEMVFIVSHNYDYRRDWKDLKHSVASIKIFQKNMSYVRKEKILITSNLNL